MKIFLFGFFLLFVVPSAFSAEPISKSVILGKVLDGSGRWESALIYYALESMDKDGLEQLARKQKLVNPKFDADLLYYRYTYDDQFEYKFYFHYVHSQCLYEVQKRDATRFARLCRDDMNTCRSKVMGTLSESDLYSCYQRSSNCTKLGEKPTAEVVDKKYCEKLYGRSL